MELHLVLSNIDNVHDLMSHCRTPLFFSSCMSHHWNNNNSYPYDPYSTLNNNICIEPNTNDVLCGRGVNIAQHPGNDLFWTLVNAKRDLKVMAAAFEKREEEQGIIAHIKGLNPPGTGDTWTSTFHAWQKWNWFRFKWNAENPIPSRSDKDSLSGTFRLREERSKRLCSRSFGTARCAGGGTRRNNETIHRKVHLRQLQLWQRYAQYALWLCCRTRVHNILCVNQHLILYFFIKIIMLDFYF